MFIVFPLNGSSFKYIYIKYWDKITHTQTHIGMVKYIMYINSNIKLMNNTLNFRKIFIHKSDALVVDYYLQLYIVRYIIIV